MRLPEKMLDLPMSDRYDHRTLVAGVMQFGRVKFDNPLVLAPLAGITDMAFRRVVKEYGCGLVVSEMVSAAGLCHGGEGSFRILTNSPDEAPLSIQVFGADPGQVAEAARICAGHGAAIVDINMGCPVPKVVKSGAGISLMRKPDLAARIVRAAKDAVDVPVTVKFRLGPDRAQPNGLEFSRMMEDAGADAMAVHARFGNTRYGVPADWTAIRPIAEAAGVPVIANGDVFTGADARRSMETAGAAGVMIGRGCLGRPWVFRQILDHLEGRPAWSPDRAEIRGTILRHLEVMLEIKPERVAVHEFRKHLGWYTKGMVGGADFRRRLAEIEDKQALRVHIDRFFETPAEEPEPRTG
jgi:tRNA-dihydrouridine synthase B